MIGLGVLFFLAPEKSYIVQALVRYWPLFLVLAGVVRVTGYLIDRHPRSPVGGIMITAVGGIVLSANLRGEHSFLQIIGNYWFWLLLGLIIGRVLRQYTHRFEDGLRHRAFTPGAIMLMALIVGIGLTANYLARNNQTLNRFDLRVDKIGDVRDYLFGNQLTIEDDPQQNFALQANARLIINNQSGDIEIGASAQSEASARLIKRIRAVSEEKARETAQGIHLRITPDGHNYLLNVDAPGVQQDFATTIMVMLPQSMVAGVEIATALGAVKLTGLRGDHTIRNGERIVITDNTGGVTVENPRGSVELERIRGDIKLSNTYQNVEMREITGSIDLDIRDGSATIERSSGPVEAQINNARIEMKEIGLNQNGNTPTAGNSAKHLVNLAKVRNSRIVLTEIKGPVTISGERSRVQAEAIRGDLTVNTSFERVVANRVDGALQIKSEDGLVEVEDAKGAVVIEATRDITVRNFRGPLSASSRLGTINLTSDGKINGDLKAVSDRGQILVSLPHDSGFRLDATSSYGRVRIRGFEQITLSRNDRSTATGYNLTETAPLLSLRSGNGDIQLRSSGLALASRDEQ